MTSDQRRTPTRRPAAGKPSAETSPQAGPRGADRLLALDRSPRGQRAAARAARGSGSRGAAPRSRRLFLILGSIAAVGCLLVAMGVGYAYWRYNQIDRVDLDLQGAAAGAPQNYLLVGSDTRAGISSSDPNAGAFLGPGAPDPGSARSDTMMILRIDPKQAKAQLLSLPRDLYVPIAGTDHSDRINAAFGQGRAVLTATIQQNFGITINHYVEVDFVGFQKIIDAIGGVPIYFQVPVKDSFTGLDVDAAGCRTLDGPTALNLARSRHLYYFEDGSWHYDGASDLSRISRQQVVIRRAIPKAMSKGFRNPVTLNELVDTVVHNVTVDKNLGVRDLVRLANRFRHFDDEHLTTYSLPVERFFTPNGEDVLKLDEQQAQPTLDIFRGVDPTASARKLVSVKVLNGSGAAEQAANVAGALERVGFRIDGTGNSSAVGIDHAAHTQIRYSPTDLPAAQDLARFLSVEPELVPVDGSDTGMMELVTGDDFTTVRTEPKPAPSTTTTTEPASTTTTTTTLPVWIPGPPPEGKSCG